MGRIHRALMTTASAGTSLALAATPAPAAPPSNDTFAQAVPVGIPSLVAGTLTDASLQSDEPAHGGLSAGGSVWFTFEPATSGRVEAGRIADRGMIVAVYSGTTLADLRLVALGRWDPDTGALPRAVFDAVAGTRYWIAVAGQTDDRPFELRLRRALLPANDTFAAARAVRVPGVVRGSLLDATGELGEPALYADAERVGIRSLWYRFEAGHAARYTVDASASSAATVVGVYTGEETARLRRVGVRAGDPAIVRFTARKGETYHVQVDSLSMRDGDVTLEISDGSIAAKGVEVDLVPAQSVASLRKRGLALHVATRRETTVALELRVSARTQRRLGLASPVLGRTRGALRPGQRLAADIALGAAARRALRGRHVLAATLRVRLLSDAPNRVEDIPVELPD